MMFLRTQPRREIDRFPFQDALPLIRLTAVEQRLMPALERLKDASPLQLARIALRGLFARAESQDVRDCLARMALDRPGSFSERAYAALVRGALG